MTIDDGIATTEKTADELMGRMFEATIGAFDLLSVYLGDRLGLYRALRDGGPATADDLATRAGIDRALCARVARATGGNRIPRGRRRFGACG